jgi:predicted ABC-type ATPase
VAVAGANGAGKSTVGARLLKDTLGIEQFVNADDIARGLSGFAPESVALEAGRIMLRHIAELARRRETFAFETTLSGRTYARLIEELMTTGYRFHLIFLWLESPELAVQRVAMRVRRGGHSIPAAVVHRRYHRGVRNFRELYRPLAATWKVYDNSRVGPARAVALGTKDGVVDVVNTETWRRIEGSSSA